MNDMTIDAPSDAQAPDALKEQIVGALRNVFDPEIPVNIYDLGLIYAIEIDNGDVKLKMTLTAPGCPVAQTFPATVENAVKAVPGVNDAAVELVWDPPWSSEHMSEAAKLQLGML
jgi:FeS assembly SUF system protein